MPKSSSKSSKSSKSPKSSKSTKKVSKRLSRGHYSQHRPNIKISHRSQKSSSYIPKYKIENAPSFASVVMKLAPDQSVYSNEHRLSYMDPSIKVSKRSSGGIFAGIVRGIFTTESFLQSEFTGSADVDSNNELVLANNLPGDIKDLMVLPGEEFLISTHCLIAFTPNVKLNTTVKWSNILMGDTPFLTTIRNDSDKPGMVWLAGYGGIKTLRLAENEDIIVAKGLVVASEFFNHYKVSMKEFTSFSMKFSGPCVIYVQGRNIHSFIDFMAGHIKGKKS